MGRQIIGGLLNGALGNFEMEIPESPPQTWDERMPKRPQPGDVLTRTRRRRLTRLYGD